MQTVHQAPAVVNSTLSADDRSYRHGEDRAILHLSRENCTNAEQRAGWQAMTGQMDAWQAAQESSTPEIDKWAYQLHKRQDEADRRRAWALALEAEADAILEEMESPFYSGHEHQGAEVEL